MPWQTFQFQYGWHSCNGMLLLGLIQSCLHAAHSMQQGLELDALFRSRCPPHRIPTCSSSTPLCAVCQYPHPVLQYPVWNSQIVQWPVISLWTQFYSVTQHPLSAATWHHRLRFCTAAASWQDMTVHLELATIQPTKYPADYYDAQPLLHMKIMAKQGISLWLSSHGALINFNGPIPLHISSTKATIATQVSHSHQQAQSHQPHTALDAACQSMQLALALQHFSS